MIKLSKSNEGLRKLQLQLKEDSMEDNLLNNQMKEIYIEQRKAMEEFEQFIAYLFVTYSVENYLKPRRNEKAEIINKSESILVSMGKTLGNYEVDKVTELLKENFVDFSNKSAYIYELGGIRTNFKIEREEFINAIVNKEFKGEEFQSRIWNNKADLIDSLHKEILYNLKGKTTLNQAIKNIRQRFNVGAYESKRLFITELARVQSEAHIEIANKAGIKKLLFDATLDNKTSNICRRLDGTTWDIDDPKKPVIPAHPNCRSCWISITDSWRFTNKMDNQDKVIIDYKNYNEWLRSKK